MTLPLILIAASSLLLLLLLGLGYYFARVLLFPHNRTYEKTLKKELESGTLSPKTWENLDKTALSIPSPFGYDLAGYYLPSGDACHIVIVSHGITNNLIGSVKYARIFLDLGFNVLIYDHRNHGKSGGRATTFGYYEQHDLSAVIDWVLAQHGPFEQIGIHGESMGAAIAILAAARDPRVDFLVTDCSYANLRDQIAHRLEEDFHLPAFPLLPLATIWARILTGMRFNTLHPEEALPEVDAPVLIIHGEADAYIPPSHARRLAETPAGAPRTLWLAPDADHAHALHKNPRGYPQQVSAFLKSHEILPEDL
jgi:hypothetical protein